MRTTSSAPLMTMPATWRRISRSLPSMTFLCETIVGFIGPSVSACDVVASHHVEETGPATRVVLATTHDGMVHADEVSSPATLARPTHLRDRPADDPATPEPERDRRDDHGPCDKHHMLPVSQCATRGTVKRGIMIFSPQLPELARQ